MGADDRVRGALLAGLASFAVLLGAGWWRHSAPVLGPVDASPSPSTLARPQRVFTLDPRTGQGPEEDPDETVLAEPLDPQNVVLLGSLWEARSHLTPGDGPLVRQVNPEFGERHLLTASCTGPGTLTVEWSGAEEDYTSLTTTCAATPIVQPLTASGGPMLVRFTVEDGAVGLDARLARQP
ncbi:hypothetical protein [Micromonospora narathiwatensis]|uniref:Uncharacterized protein n=1 Tax=Micromonospora narathiwatensis TaxID=299146 RepID=A0A1A9A8I8_9ACTN|nr:hypothetical protein [Micromonospora narathiwatensis]SBT52428.1 hypothetical protein GA0070621_4417 [Micromonospora narathiwatensis]